MQNLPGLSAAFKVILPIGIAYATNRFLNSRVLGGLGSNDSWDWTKEIVLVTGGNSGMGNVIVQQFAEKNIKVVVLDVSPPQSPLPPGVFFYEADVTSPDALHKAAEHVRQRIGDPTVLINNAGIGLGHSILECTEAHLRRTFEVNILAHFWTVQEFLPAMIKANHGHVVTMASMASFVVIAGNVDYSCTKAGALAFHEGLGQELKHRYSADNMIARPEFKEPIIEPEEVANAVVEQVLGGRSGQIILPRWQGIVSGITGFPPWLQERIRDSKAGIIGRKSDI